MFFVSITLCLAAVLGASDPISLLIPANRPAVEWAANELVAALSKAGAEASVNLNPCSNAQSPPTLFSVPGEFEIQLHGLPTAPPNDAAPALPESYLLVPMVSGVHCRFADEAGGMYALLDLAERVRVSGLDGLKLAVPETHAPAIEFRAVNPFLSIPLADKDGKRDWDHWWFTDEEYWRGYLDLLARSRINWIDIHGMYDIQVTSFPNIWPYFVVSEKYPDVGVEPAQARKNLDMLHKICRMARERGIQIAIMNYTGGWNWPGCRKAPERPVADFIEYTKEGLKQIVAAPPGEQLGMIGFRIGESGYGEDFYAKSYVAALEELGRPLPLYTRTWGAKKDKLMELGRLYPDKFIIEIKYNGEQMGPPWHLAGGRMAGWRDYSFQDYLFYPRAYKVAWQIRTNGTHRVFQWASYEFIRDCVQTANLAGSIGFCVEPMSTYYPLTDFLHKEPLFHWEYERNPLWYLMWGRLAYDPQTPESVFRAAAREHWGNEYGDRAYDALQSLSRIVPFCKTRYSLGPDHRDHAPELEWGGSIRQWAAGAPFDTFEAMSPTDYAREMITGDYTARRTPLEAAVMLEQYGAETLHAQAAIPLGVSNALDDLKLDAQMTATLGAYYAGRLRTATIFALAEMSGDTNRMEDLRQFVRESAARWQELAALGNAGYRPFLDTLRMHTESYRWSDANANFKRDEADLRTMLVSDVRNTSFPARPVSDNGKLKLHVWPDAVDKSRDKQTLAVHATIGGLTDAEVVRHVRLLWKPFRSESDWRRIAMAPDGDGWKTTVDLDRIGALYGLEVIANTCTAMARFEGQRPYGVIDPWPVARASPQSR